MAQIQSVDTHIQINQPQRLTGRAVTDYASPIAEGIGVLVEAFKPKKDPDQVARDLLGELNRDLDSMKGSLVNQEMRPSEFRDKAQANFLTKLSANKDISPQMWGAIKTQYNSRLDTLSKEHWFQSEGKQMTIDYAGNVQIAYEPGRSEEDQDVEALMKQFPGEWRSIVNMIDRETDNPTARTARIRYFTDLGVRKLASDMTTQLTTNEHKTKGLVKEENQEELRKNLMVTVGSELQTLLRTYLPEAGINDKAYPDLLESAQALKSMLIIDAANAGMTVGQLEGVIDSQVGFMKSMFDAKSKYGADSYELKAEEQKIALRIAKMKGELSDADLFMVEESNGMTSLVMNAMYGNMLSNNAANAIGMVRVSAAQNKDLDRLVKAKNYLPILDTTERLFRDLMLGSFVDLFSLQQYYETIQRSPEAVGQEHIDRVTTLKQTFDILMRDDPNFKRAMTMGKTQLPKKD